MSSRGTGLQDSLVGSEKSANTIPAVVPVGLVNTPGVSRPVRGPLTKDTVKTPVDLGDSDQVLVSNDMSVETSSRSDGCPPTELSDNVVEASEENGGSPDSQSDASKQKDWGAKTTGSQDGVGQGILHSDSSDKNVSVALSHGRRAAKVMSRIIVGNPQGWHFNQAKGC